MRKRVEEVLDLLGIAPLRSRDITTLSGGERQRVAIAGVLARRPGLLVLDEPTSQLDPWGADEVLTSLHRLNDDLGIAVVLAEHRLDRVAGAADTMRIVNADGTMIDLPPQEALAALPELNQPPLARFAMRSGWPTVPLTIKEARRRLVGHPHSTRSDTRSVPAGPTVASLEKVTVSRGDATVLENVSINFSAGQITAVMGRNGAGKTTLLRAMLGMLAIDSGHVVVAGRAIEPGAMSQLAGLVGYLPQDPARLLFAESVAQEIDATIRHLPPGRRARDADELLAAFDLTDLALRHPRDLSAGERERCALAAVLAGSPEFLLLDEPTRGMDGARKHALMTILDRERARGCAIVVATHDVELVAEWADRVVLIGNREIIADDHPRRVLGDSVTFSPQMNRLFGGEILTVDDAIRHVTGVPRPIP
jgi:energy-coupling factor transport system ATP-binding protein